MRTWLAANVLIAIGCASVARGESRPTISPYRWEEDWSALADVSQRTEWGDALKFVPLSSDAASYLSLGVTLRERMERLDASLFGAAGRAEDTYLLHRLELHGDLHLSADTRVFVQLENALAPGRASPAVVDENKADLRLAFIDTRGQWAGGEYLLRFGRQEVQFDLQRFASVRDGVNVRQAFDGLRAEYERGHWQWSTFLSQPVQYRNGTAFDDFSDRHFRFGGVRARWRPGEKTQLSATYSLYRNDHATFLAGSGAEHRHSLDAHYSDTRGGFDWDVEAMGQRGHLGAQRIEAWALGSLAGYTFEDVAWHPRLGLQFDAASGDRRPADGRVGTFNPLFPNGYYLTQSGLTGYANLIHLKESLTLTPVTRLKVLIAVGELWRQATEDAVYVQPEVPVGRTAGESGAFTGLYYQVRVDWFATRSFALALEVADYDVGRVIRRAGGHDATYLGFEARWGW